MKTHKKKNKKILNQTIHKKRQNRLKELASRVTKNKSPPKLLLLCPTQPGESGKYRDT